MNVKVLLNKFPKKIKRINEKKINFFCYDKKFLKNSEKKIISKELYNITTESWGDFGKKFIEKHTINSEILLIASHKNKIIGYAAVNKKKIDKKYYYYFDFLIILPGYQKIGIGKHLIKILSKKIIKKNLLKLRLKLRLITITPNPRILGIIKRISKKIYPNPYLLINNKPEKTPYNIWKVAKKILKSSHDTSRKLERRGLVLHDSYKKTPWLIYDPNKVPWDKDHKINNYCNKIIDYSQKTGKEFIVIAEINLINLIL